MGTNSPCFYELNIAQYSVFSRSLVRETTFLARYTCGAVSNFKILIRICVYIRN